MSPPPKSSSGGGCGRRVGGGTCLFLLALFVLGHQGLSSKMSAISPPALATVFHPVLDKNGPSPALVDLGPSERCERGSRRSAVADHIHLEADVQICSLSWFQIAGV
jgi:hypothetical protein